MRLVTLTLHGTRGLHDRTPVLFLSVSEATQYLTEINARRAVTGLPPAVASLVSQDTAQPTLWGL